MYEYHRCSLTNSPSLQSLLNQRPAMNVRWVSCTAPKPTVIDLRGCSRSGPEIEILQLPDMDRTLNSIKANAAAHFLSEPTVASVTSCRYCKRLLLSKGWTGSITDAGAPNPFEHLLRSDATHQARFMARTTFAEVAHSMLGPLGASRLVKARKCVTKTPAPTPTNGTIRNASLADLSRSNGMASAPHLRRAEAFDT